MGQHYDKQKKKDGRKWLVINLSYAALLPILVLSFNSGEYWVLEGLFYWFIIGILGVVYGFVFMNTPNKKIDEAWEKDHEESAEKRKQWAKEQKEEDNFVKEKIVALLKRKLEEKITANDIHRFLDIRDNHGGEALSVDGIKELCEDLYFDEKIQRTGNYRYYILEK